MNIAIVDYQAGNVRSVAFALERLGVQAHITANADELRAADKVIFPGVGEAGSTMRHLQDRALVQLLPQLTQPFLGICLGMQLMCAFSEEGQTPCLNIVPNQVRRFPAQGKVPHMGWNSIHQLRGPLFDNIADGAYVYFVHSYYVEQAANTIAACNYLLPFSAGIQHNNFYAVQFHPEKSGEVGARVLQNFLAL